MNSIFEIDPKDFESMRLDIAIFNATSKTGVRQGNRHFHDGKSEVDIEEQGLEIDLVELLDDGLILDLPKNTCSQNHILEVWIRVFMPDKSMTQFKFMAKVDDLKPNLENRISAHITLIKPNIDEWNKFNQLFLKRQDEIDNFMKAAKG